jgi:hypothetical protein
MTKRKGRFATLGAQRPIRVSENIITSLTRIGETMKKILVSLAVAMLLLLVLAGIAYAATGVTDPVVLKDLAKVRQATAKYHDVNVALADGFVPTPHCIEEPGLGVMGIHYINPARLMDPAINLLEPEILLYIETKNGLKLLGVEYFQGIGAPDTPIPDPAPPAAMILGRLLDGPMDAHKPGQPPHYDLHAWVWKANPSGIFAPFNPNVSCP